jgi:hypothetical protein
MSTNVTVETLIGREREAVARFTMDPGNDTLWISALSEARLLTDPPVGRGSRVARVASFLGRRIEYVNEIVEYDPPARLVMRSVKGPFPMTVTYRFDEADGGTRVGISTEGDAGGFYRLAAPLLDRAVRRGVEKDLANLKRILETAGDER